MRLEGGRVFEGGVGIFFEGMVNFFVSYFLRSRFGLALRVWEARFRFGEEAAAAVRSVFEGLGSI